MVGKQLNSKLSDEQKKVLFEQHTEAPFSGKYISFNKDGSYVCVNCGQVLFISDTKFDSGCGWPSFFNPASASSVNLYKDSSLDMLRVEVRCAKCDAHLGHVFNDAHDQPTGMRFCINSVSLDFREGDKTDEGSN